MPTARGHRPRTLLQKHRRDVLAVVLASTFFINVGSAAAQSTERSGKEVVEAVCAACHGAGSHGAPMIGDKKAWVKLSSRGLTGLSENALKGLRRMAPHGGNLDLTDAEVRTAIIYMFNQSTGSTKAP